MKKALVASLIFSLSWMSGPALAAEASQDIGGSGRGGFGAGGFGEGRFGEGRFGEGRAPFAHDWSAGRLAADQGARLGITLEAVPYRKDGRIFVRIAEVDAGSPLAGTVAAGDYLFRIDDTELQRTHDVFTAIAAHRPGENVTVYFLDRDDALSPKSVPVRTASIDGLANGRAAGTALAAVVTPVPAPTPAPAAPAHTTTAAVTHRSQPVIRVRAIEPPQTEAAASRGFCESRAGLCILGGVVGAAVMSALAAFPEPDRRRVVGYMSWAFGAA
ncbi:PDZ domain-containing protein (plasmid) [Tistrella mobilis]|uniref:PDZ domain-containing protein n=1 Tax=Tistrella mobilis TaxID=171437 RepID=UPI00355605F9